MTPAAPETSTVVVHADGSWDSYRAVKAAALEARSRALDLTVLVLSSPLARVGAAAGHPLTPDAPTGAEATADRAEREARALVPELTVRRVVLAHPSGAGDPGELDHLGARARLLVLGRYGRGGRPALSPGSVTADLAAVVAAPVLVIGRDPTARAPAFPRPQVTVGLGGDPDDQSVADEALDVARRRGWPLVAVCGVAGSAGTPGRTDRLAAARAAAQQACARDSGDSLDHDAAPVSVRVEAVGHDPLGALRWHCGSRDLAVVGHHRRTPPPGDAGPWTAGGPGAGDAHLGALEPGSLAARLLHTGLCDVLVVPLAPAGVPQP